MPLAAAALVLAMAIGGGVRPNALDGGLPDSPVLRSSRTSALLFPRGRVLEAAAGRSTYASRPLFEVTRVDGAESYRFELRQTAGGAFDGGAPIWSARTTSPIASCEALSAGTFAWTAWAEVDGLERDLGTIDFTVVPADSVALFERAAGSARSASASRTRDDVRHLHAAGFLTDARHRARSLPPGTGRDDYLSGGR